jgi:cobalt-zinc-cadmium efflux system membrane fusion protein
MLLEPGFVGSTGPNGSKLLAPTPIVISAVVLSLALFVGWLLLKKNPQPAARTEVASPVKPGEFKPKAEQWSALKVMPVTTMTFRTEQFTDGKIAIGGDRTTPVFSPYSGRVTKIIANLGDHVKKGEPLLTLEATEFSQAQNDLKSATVAINAAQSQLTLNQTVEARKHALYDAKAGSLQDWQQSQADVVTAQNNLRSAEVALASVRNRLRILGKSATEITALEEVSGADPTAVVTAPMTGDVIDRQVGPGQYIQAGAANPLYSIADLSVVWLIANVRETDAPLMHRGAPVEVQVMAFPGRVFKATITYVAPAVDPNTHRLPVRAEVENPGELLKPEMFARFSIVTGGESSAPAVPETAVVYEADTARVWVAGNDTVASRPIQVGRVVNGMVEVVSGLQAGEKIVTSGTLFIDRAARVE